MESNNQSSIFLKAIVVVVLLIMLTVGVTYAYFKVNITGVESASTISIGGATLKIVYEGIETIKAENIIPGWSSKKYFNVDVTNTSGTDITYDINLVVTNSNFYTTDDLGNSYLEYALYECESSEDKTCEAELQSASILDIQSGSKLVYSVTTNTTSKIYYALEIKFPNQDSNQSQIGTDDQRLTFSGYVTIVSTDEVYIPPFTTDSWATIATVVQANKEATSTYYKVGDEKEVEIDTDDDGIPESYTVRIANNSNYDCDLDSKTACGFVVEFVDIVGKKSMNVTGNSGGWPVAILRSYLNGDTSDHLTYNGTKSTLFSKLPIELQNVILDTTVISGHGSSDSNSEREDGNWESVDKLYLLSTGEIYSYCLTNNCNDTASYPYNGSGAITTRQLDFYKGVTVYNNYDRAIKLYNGTNSWWWNRSAVVVYSNYFHSVNNDGRSYGCLSNESGGIAPVFRLA